MGLDFMNTENLLAALYQDHSDDLCWQALADSIEEAGDTQRAELERLRLKLRSFCDNDNDSAKNEARLQELLAAGVTPTMPEREVNLGKGVRMKFVLIPPGRFMMGSSDGLENEKPVHAVEISKAFYMGVYAVTQSQYKRVMKENPSYFQAGKDGSNKVKGMATKDFPVETVSHTDAVKFCEALNEMDKTKPDGYEYHLPTEAEWEYACRGGLSTSKPFHFGDTLKPNQANFDESGLGRTCKVGSYPPNAFGLYDMHGNVWEWCHDWYDANYYAKLVASAKAQGPSGGEESSDPFEPDLSEAAVVVASASIAGRRFVTGTIQRSVIPTTSVSASSVDPQGPSEGEESSDPLELSGAAAGSTSTSTAGRCFVTGAIQCPGSTALASGSSVDPQGPAEDEQSSDPVELSEAVAGTASASSAGRRFVAGTCRRTGASSSVSESSVDPQGPTEGEKGSDPPKSDLSEAAAGSTAVSTAGRRFVSGPYQRAGTTASVSESSVDPQGPSEGENGSDPLYGGLSEVAAGTSCPIAAGRRFVTGTIRRPGTLMLVSESSVDPQGPSEGEKGSDPFELSGAAAGSTSTSTASRRFVSMTSRRSGSTPSVSGSSVDPQGPLEDEQSSDPTHTELSGAAAGNSTASSAGRRFVTGTIQRSGPTATSASESSVDPQGPSEGENGSDPTHTECTEAAVGVASASIAGRRFVTGTIQRSGPTATSASESSVDPQGPSEGENGSDPTHTELSGAAAGTSSAGTAGRRFVAGSSRRTGTSSSVFASSVDPQGPLDGLYRVIRGGRWFNFGKNCRSSFRNWIVPSFRDSYFGFRVALVPLKVGNPPSLPLEE